MLGRARLAARRLRSLAAVTLAFTRLCSEEGLDPQELLFLFPLGREWLNDSDGAPEPDEQEVALVYRTLRTCWG